MPDDIRAIMERSSDKGALLSLDERLLWVGLSDGKHDVQGNKMLLLYSLLGAGFILCLEVIVIYFCVKSHSPLSTALGTVLAIFGLPFVAISAVIVSVSFATLSDSLRTAYAITDRHIVIIRRKRDRNSGTSHEINSYRPMIAREGSDGNGITIAERADGFGDLTITENCIDGVLRYIPGPIHLWGIPEVRTVERIIQEAFATPYPETLRRPLQALEQKEESIRNVRTSDAR